MVALAVRREPIGRAWRIAASPWSIVPDIDPDPAFLHATGAGAPAPRVEHLDRRVIGVQAVGLHDLALDQLAQRPERGNRLAAPVDQRRARDLGAVARDDLTLTVQRGMVIKLRSPAAREQARSGHTALDRPRRDRKST